MRFARVTAVALSATAVACGGFLSFGEDSEVPPPPGVGAGTEDAATPPSPTDPTDGAASGDATDDGGPSLQTTPDARPVSPLLPRLATFEDGILTGAKGADAHNGMEVTSTALRGSFSAQAKDASRWLDFNFGTAPPSELYVAFAFRIDEWNVAPRAKILRFDLKSATIDAEIDNFGTLYLKAGANEAKLSSAPLEAGVPYVLGVHARVSDGLLEGALATPTSAPIDTVPRFSVTWAMPTAVVASHIGELSGTELRMTVDQIGFRETGFEK